MLKNIAVTLFFVSVVAGAGELPKLEGTELFTKTLRECKEVNADWNHPTKQVLIERGAKLQKVSLCNDGKVPIFYAEMPYDPSFGHNNNYFFPLYSAMLQANGNWPFAIVATTDNTIMFITQDAGSVRERLEMYAE